MQRYSKSLMNLVGKTVTLSCIVDGELHSATATVPSTTGTFLTVPFTSGRFEMWNSSDNDDMGGAQFYFDASHTVLAAKLELGDTQTLAHKEGDTWVLNEIPDFGEQLARCEYYHRVSASGHYFPGAMYSSADGVFLFPFTGGMRVTPSIEISLPGTIQDSAGVTHNLSANNYSIESVDRFGAKIVLHNLSGIPVGPAHICDAYFALSADL